MKFYRLLIKLYIIIVLGEIAYTNPTVSISSIVSSITDRPIPITITFSELVTGFESSDVIVSNGTINYLEDFESGSFGTLPWNFGGNYSWNWDIAEAGTWGADGAFDIWWPPDAVYAGNYCAYSKNLIDNQWSEMNLSLIPKMRKNSRKGNL